MSFEVSDPKDLEAMRVIFNASLADMATKGEMKPVSPEDQMRWWMEPYPSKRAWMVEELGNDDPVGFIVLTDRVGFETPMFAIAPTYRGKGYARWFVQEYINLAKGALAGEQLQSNEIICRLNREAGWEIIETRRENADRVIDYLYHPGSSRQNVIIYHRLRGE